MEIHTREDVIKKVIQLCDICGYNDECIVSNCIIIIDKYLSFENSSIDKLYSYLEDGINNNFWRLTWQNINEEIDKLSGQYYIEQEKLKVENQKILLNYEPLNLGERLLEEKELNRIKVNLGVIDAYGVFHTLERLGVDKNEWPDHRKMANYLKLGEKIIQYYIRVGSICGINDGVLCAESISYGNEISLKDFLLTEKMAIALYNSIMSKNDSRFSTFEEKLAYYGTEFGYYSTKYNAGSQIYNQDLFNRNTKVLSYTLGSRFDKKFFVDVLKK